MTRRRSNPARKFKGKLTAFFKRTKKALGIGVLAATCFAAGTRFTGAADDWSGMAILAGLSAASQVLHLPALDAQNALSSAPRMPAQRATTREMAAKVIHVADGDTITVLRSNGDTARIRLLGIDAPEHDQAGGNASKMHLLSLVMGRTVSIRWQSTDHYGRILGKVLAGGKDVNLEQVQTGNAWFYRNYRKSLLSSDAGPYEAAEARARQQRLGLWRDANPMPPWDFREAQREEGGKNEFQDFKERSSAPHPAKKSLFRRMKDSLL